MSIKNRGRWPAPFHTFFLDAPHYKGLNEAEMNRRECSQALNDIC